MFYRLMGFATYLVAAGISLRFYRNFGTSDRCGAEISLSPCRFKAVYLALLCLEKLDG